MRAAKNGAPGLDSGGTGANAEIARALHRLRDRSRDLVRNNPYATKAVQALVSNMVGTGLQPRARAETPEIARLADRLWLQFSTQCDADGLTDFAGLQALVVRSLVESGEVLVRFRDRRIEDGLTVPLQCQVLEADHLDSWKNEDLPDGGFILQGIEFDPIGRRRAYWLFSRHPGETRGIRAWPRSGSCRACAAYSIVCAPTGQGTLVRPVILKLRDLAIMTSGTCPQKIEPALRPFDQG
jgi:lambda family phage portal protein